MRLFLLCDIDGSSTLGGGNKTEPHAPPEEFAAAAAAASRTPGQKFVLVTGQPGSVAARMREMLGGLNGAPVLAEYGTLMVRANGTVEHLLSREQLADFFANRAQIERAVRELGGDLDGRGAELGVNAFWRTRAEFHHAKATWDRLVAEEAALQHAFVNGGQPGCRAMWHPEDLSANFLPSATSKQVAVDWARRHGTIAVAIGDTGSDIPLLKAAKVPVACHDEGEAVHPELAAIAAAKGGYVAPEDKPHGYGALEGFRLAKRVGLVTF